MSSWTHHRARVAALSRDRAPDDPELVEARARMRDAEITRAVDDPVALARAARIVRTALARRKLTVAELTAPPAEHQSGGEPDAA